MLRQGGGVAAGFQLPSQLGRCRSCWWRSRASGGPLSARSRRRAMLEEVQNRRLLVDSDSDEEAAKPSAKPVAKTKPTDILQEVSRRQSLFHPPCLLPLPRAAGPGLCSSLPGPALRRRRSPVAVLLRGRPSTSPDVRHARAAQKACVPVHWAERRQGSEGISACLLTKGMPSAGGGQPPSSLRTWLPFPFSPKRTGSPVPRAHLSHDSRTPKVSGSETTAGDSLPFASLLSVSETCGTKGLFQCSACRGGIIPADRPPCAAAPCCRSVPAGTSARLGESKLPRL